MDREDIKVLVRNWWDIYNDESLDFKALPDELEAAVRKPIRAALAESGTVKFVTAPSAA